ncbi:MAG TPA: ABC transporter permease [Chloroflexota bacterium]|nr:ABC transporter permease [Chloroflexota bacterium]
MRRWRPGLPWLLALAGVTVLLLAWEAAVRALKVPLYILPAPTDIWRQLGRDWPLLLRHARPTAIEAAGGFAIGNGVAIALAVAFVHSPPLERTLFPVAIALRTIPLVAITPLLVVWLGNGYAPKIAIAALISFFPTLVNMVRGLSALDRRALDLLRTYSATWWQVLVKVRLPASLPYLFASLKISATSAVLGAVVAEWIGSDRGLGYLVVASTFEFRIARLWATIAVSTAVALLGFLVVVVAERLLVPWRDDVSTQP